MKYLYILHKLYTENYCGKQSHRMLCIFINNIERMSRNKWSIEKAPLYKMACKTIMERIEGELCAK